MGEIRGLKAKRWVTKLAKRAWKAKWVCIDSTVGGIFLAVIIMVQDEGKDYHKNGLGIAA